MHKIDISSVDDQQDVDNYKKVVRIPKGVEASDPIKRLGEFNNAPPKPTCCKDKSNHH